MFILNNIKDNSLCSPRRKTVYHFADLWTYELCKKD